MNALPSELARDFAQAIELRATGVSWLSVAEKLGRDLVEIRAWPDAFPSEWKSQYEAAELRINADISAESTTHLRLLMRSEDDELRARVGQMILNHRVKLLKLDRERSTQTPRSDSPCEVISDDELYIYITELLHHLQPKSLELRAAIADRDSA